MANEQIEKKYEFSVKILGHELFELSLGTNDESGKWTKIGIVITFCTLVIIGAYGEKFVNLYKMVVG